MSHCGNSRVQSLTSRGLQSGLMVSILVFFPLPPSRVAHDLAGGAAPCNRSPHAARPKASGCHQGAAVPGWHSLISWRNHHPWGVLGVPQVLALQLPLGTRGLISSRGYSCLDSTCGQNGGIGFEKKSCHLFFKQQKGKLKDWDLPSRFSLRHWHRFLVQPFGRTFNPFAPAAMPLGCKVVLYCQRSRGGVFTPTLRTLQKS